MPRSLPIPSLYTPAVHDEIVDIAIIGAGAAGLMAGISAGRATHSAKTKRTIIALDGARTLGAKILVAGGGRCNVTHDHVDETAFAGSTRNAIRKVLLQFDGPQTVNFFRDLGVHLKREETGKLFPTTDKARTVLNALLDAARDAGVELRYPWRVGNITRDADGTFLIADDESNHIIRAARIILATGGMALPKSGSDGVGYRFATSLGHTVTDRVFPGLVPLLLPPGHFLTALSGISSVATLELRSGTGRKIISFTDAMLCTHFGLSGPAVLDISRYWTDAYKDDASVTLVINWLNDLDAAQADRWLLEQGGKAVGALLRDRLPRRLIEAICMFSRVEPNVLPRELPKDRRKALAGALTEMVLPITGDRGFTHAEVTAGGVPLREINLAAMESRITPGLHLCGEICDVDGRIGGYNFQWAWASGWVAGKSAAVAYA